MHDDDDDDDDDIEFHTPKKKKEPPKIIVYIVMIIIGFLVIKWCAQSGEERYQDAINNVRLPDGWSEDGDEVRNIQNIIRAYGYKCDKINSVVGSSYRGFSVNCNDYRYTYDLKDVGGNWTATVR